MRKKLGKTLIAGMMSISMLITQMSSGTVFSNAATVQSAEDWKGIWGVYRILNEGQERPESFDEFLSKKWSFAGRGYIHSRETVCGDVDTVTAMIKEKSAEVEEIEANLEENEQIEWFAARQQGNLWYVYGQVCEKQGEENSEKEEIVTPTIEPTTEPTIEPTQTPVEIKSAEDWKGIWGVYRILNEGQERPESFDEFLSKSWSFAGRGYINSRETICGDVDTVTAMIKEKSAEVEEIEANLEENEQLEWFAARQQGNLWYVYGQVCEKQGEENSEKEEIVTPTIEPTTEPTIEPTQTPVEIKTAEDWKGIWGVYRILNEGQERPESFDEFLSKSWSFAGRGYINFRETICGDVDTVTAMIKEKSVEVEEIEANLEENEQLEWFAARQQGNLWYVYGQVCEKEDDIIHTEIPKVTAEPTTEPTAKPEVTVTPTTEPTEKPEVTVEPTTEPTAKPEVTVTPTTKPTEKPEVTVEPTTEPSDTVITLTNATFKVLDRGQPLPLYSDLYVWNNWTTVGTGKISKTEEIINDEDFVESCVVDVPEAAQDLLEDGEEIRWISMKKFGDWVVYGKICKVGEETDATIDVSTLTDYSNCYFTRFYILQYGQEQPTSLEEIDQLKWNYAQTGYVTKQRRILGYKNVEPLLAKIPTGVSLEEDEDIHWIAMTANTNQCKVYGVIYNVNIEKSREQGALDSDETEIIVDTFADAKALNAIYKDGAIIKTKGYYKVGDGGAATYEVSNHGNGKTFSTFTTATGQHVNMVVENSTIDLRQLGAGVCEEIIYNTSDIVYNDDAARLSEAIALIDAYDGGEIYIPEGNYRCASKVSMGGDHYRIIGDGSNSVLYTDNGYQGDEHFLTIVGKDITLDSIRVEAHETKWVPYYRQCSLLAASDINILNCEFSVQDNVISYNGNTDRQYTNITLYTGWHNVKIDNCLMEQMGCVERGACLGIIDMWSNGCSDVSVTNCVMRQNAHDEMLGIFTKTGADAAIENIYIANNKMYTASAPNVSKKTMAITIAYDESRQISNVRFVDNEVVADVPSNFMTFGALSDCIIENNKFTINHTVSYNAGVIFDTRKGVTVRNNDVKITSPKGGGVTQIFKQDGVFENNTVDCDGYVYSIMYYKGKAIGNNIHIKGGCHAIAIDPEQLSNNNITVEGYLDNYIHYTKLLTDSTITNNIFNYLYNDAETDYHPSLAGNVIYAGFHAGINGYTVTFSENTINAPNATTKNKAILLYGVGGSDEQTFIIKDNKVGVYKWIRNLYAQSLGGVQTDNNVDADGNIVDYQTNVTYFYNEVK